MSTTSLQPFAPSFSPFPSTQSLGMAPSQTIGLDTLAEGSQYALEQLQLSREAGNDAATATSSTSLRSSSFSKSTDQSVSNPSGNHHSNNGPPSDFKSSQRDPLAEARSAIRKNSTSAPVRRRISRACDQCNQLRTKCDGQHPCAHCIGMSLVSARSTSVTHLAHPVCQNSASPVNMRASARSVGKHPRKI